MPIYEYKCAQCNIQFEAKQSIKDKSLLTCENCGQDSLERLISGGLAVFVERGLTDNTTLAQMADYNTRKMGKGQLEDRRHEDTMNQVEKKNLAQQELAKKYGVEPLVYKEPEKGKLGAAKINAMTPAQKQTYIERGVS